MELVVSVRAEQAHDKRCKYCGWTYVSTDLCEAVNKLLTHYADRHPIDAQAKTEAA